MKFYVDLETREFIQGPFFRTPMDPPKFKRGDGALVEVVFLTGGGTAASLGTAANLSLKFGAKVSGDYDGGHVVSETDWTKPADGAADPVYGCRPSFNTVALDTALGIGTANELAEVRIMVEIEWSLSGGPPTSTRTLIATVENDVNRGTEGTPLATPTPEDWLDARAVRFDKAQSLLPADTLQALENIGLPVATQAEMEAGTETALRSMSPSLVKSAIDALASGGGSQPSFPSVSDMVPIVTDFYSNDPGHYYAIGLAASGTFGGGIGSSAGELNRPGILTISDSASANSGARIMTNTAVFVLHAGDTCDFVVKFNGTRNTTVYRLGWQDSTGTTTPTDGLYLEVLGGATLQCSLVAIRGGVQTSQFLDWNLSPNQWYRFSITAIASDFAGIQVADASGTYLNEGYVTSNVPVGGTYYTGWGVLAYETTTDAGAILCYLDYMALYSTQPRIR